MAAVNEWNKMWNDLTFPALDEDRQEDPLEIARAREFAEGANDFFVAFGRWVIDLGKPIWEMQKRGFGKRVLD